MRGLVRCRVDIDSPTGRANGTVSERTHVALASQQPIYSSLQHVALASQQAVYSSLQHVARLDHALAFERLSPVPLTQQLLVNELLQRTCSGRLPSRARVVAVRSLQQPSLAARLVSVVASQVCLKLERRSNPHVLWAIEPSRAAVLGVRVRVSVPHACMRLCRICRRACAFCLFAHCTCICMRARFPS